MSSSTSTTSTSTTAATQKPITVATLDEAFQWQSVFTTIKDPYFVLDMFKKSIDKALYDHEIEVWLAQMLTKHAKLVPTMRPEYVEFCYTIRLDPFEIQEAKKQCFLNPVDSEAKQALKIATERYDTVQLEVDVPSFSNVRKFITIRKSETLQTLAEMYCNKSAFPIDSITSFQIRTPYWRTYVRNQFDTSIFDCDVSNLALIYVGLDWSKLDFAK